MRFPDLSEHDNTTKTSDGKISPNLAGFIYVSHRLEENNAADFRFPLICSDTHDFL